MRNVICAVCVAALVASLGSVAMAADIVTVPVGNPGNTADTAAHSGNPAGQGAVDYEYKIGTYEVTAGQYREFLNAVDPTGANADGLYNSSMNSSSYGCQITWNSGSSTYDFSGAPNGTAADWQDRPVNFVSFWDAARFANWLHNGQGAGDTETGAYTLTADGISNNTVLRNAGAQWAVTSEDEWYKAAYYKGGGTDAGYWDYPTSSDSIPSNDLVEPTDPGNNATFYDGGFTIDSPYYRTEFGAHENSESPYDTFDQGGNVWEWNEALIYGSFRGLRGGSFFSNDNLHASDRHGNNPTDEIYYIGFRVSEVPEPATLAVLMLGGIGILRRRKCVRG